MTMRYEIETPKPARGVSQRGGAERGEPHAGERDAHLSATAKSNLRVGDLSGQVCFEAEEDEEGGTHNRARPG